MRFLITVEGVPVHIPNHPCFPPSSVAVPIPAAPSPSSLGVVQSLDSGPIDLVSDESIGLVLDEIEVASCIDVESTKVDEVAEIPGPRRSARRLRFKVNLQEHNPNVPKRRVQDRWYYEPVEFGTSVPGLLAAPTTHSDGDSSAGVVPTASSFDTSRDGSPPMHRPSDTVSSSEIPLDGSGGSPHLFSSITGSGQTGRFLVLHHFPGQEMEDQSFTVTTSMTVPVLKHAIARLLQIPASLFLLVAPHLEALDHQ